MMNPLHSEPYFTVGGYIGRHRDETDQARADAIRLDYHSLQDAQYPCRHYHPRHSVFVAARRCAA